MRVDEIDDYVANGTVSKAQSHQAVIVRVSVKDSGFENTSNNKM